MILIRCWKRKKYTHNHLKQQWFFTAREIFYLKGSIQKNSPCENPKEKKKHFFPL